MARVLDVSIFDGNIRDATEVILDRCRRADKANCLISATGAHGIVNAHRDPSFRRVLDSFYMNLADGMPAVWTSRLKGDKRIERCYGPDFFSAVMIASATLGIRHYFCGGKEGVAAELQAVSGRRFRNPNVIGLYSPPFRDLADEEIRQLAEEINGLDIDVVWIGLSTPKQEQLAFRLAQHTHVHFLCTVGAAFDFHTRHLRQAPRWIQRLGLEWLFRLIMEPRRLWKRYVAVVPLFIIYEAIDLVRFFSHPRGEKELTWRP